MFHGNFRPRDEQSAWCVALSGKTEWKGLESEQRLLEDAGTSPERNDTNNGKWPLWRQFPGLKLKTHPGSK